MAEEADNQEAPEVTPEMIEAGIGALWPVEVPPTKLEAEVVSRVFAAMWRAMASMDHKSRQQTL